MARSDRTEKRRSVRLLDRNGRVATLRACVLAGLAVAALGITGWTAEADGPPTVLALDVTPIPAPPDTINGGEDADFLSGTEVADVIIGGAGDDRLRGMGGDDLISGGDGVDLLEGGEGVDILEGGDGDDHLDGGEGADWLFGDDGNDFLQGGDGADVIDGGPGDDVLLGGAGDDTMEGGDGLDFLLGHEGDDTLDGSDGPDIIFGGAGNDDLHGGDGADVVNGGPGDDIVRGGGGQNQLSGGAGDDLMLGDDGPDVMLGGPGNDDMGGDDGDDVLHGGPDDDLLSGGDGDDDLSGGEGADVLLGDPGNDFLKGGEGNDRLEGGRNDDRLDGGPGDDVLLGGNGTDQILGGDGNDMVVLRAGDVNTDRVELVDGGAGADTVLLNGFSTEHITNLVVREMPAVPDTTTPPADPTAPDPDSATVAVDSIPVPPQLSFTLTDPISGGTYLVSRVEAIAYLTRVAMTEGWGEDASLIIVNRSDASPANVYVEWFGEEGRPPPPDTVGQAPDSAVAAPAVAAEQVDVAPLGMELEIPPLGASALSGEEFARPGGTSFLIRSDVPVSAIALGDLRALGPVGFAEGPMRDHLFVPVRLDRSEGVTTVVSLSVDGMGRSVQIQLLDDEGDEVGSGVELEVADDGHTLALFHELFPRIPTFTGIAIIEAGASVLGAVSQVGPGNQGLVTLPLIAGVIEGDRSPRASPRVFPGLLGGSAPASLTLTERGEGEEQERAVGAIEFFDAAGAPLAVEVDTLGPVTSVPFALDNLMTTRYDFPVIGELGSLRVRVDSGTVAAWARAPQGDGTIAGQGVATVGARLVAPLIQADPGEGGTAVAIHSTGDAATVQLTLRDGDGAPIPNGTAQVELPENGTVVQLLSDLFPNVPEATPVGTLTVESDVEIALAVTFLGGSAGFTASLPVRTVAGGPD